MIIDFELTGLLIVPRPNGTLTGKEVRGGGTKGERWGTDFFYRAIIGTT